MTSSYDLSAFLVSISNVVKSCSKMSHMFSVNFCDGNMLNKR